MSAEEFFIYLLLVFAAVSVGIYIRMTTYLHRHGVQVSIFKFRLMLPYISQYRKLYAQEGVGGANLFTYWLVSINGALMCAILLFLTA